MEPSEDPGSLLATERLDVDYEGNPGHSDIAVRKSR